MQKGWIAFFQEWLSKNQVRLKDDNISVEVVGVAPYAPNSIHADFYAKRHEATVQLWEDGQSDFHLLDWAVADRDPNYQPEVTHYDFFSWDEMLTALEALVKRMIETAELPHTPASLFISGHSETVYHDPIPGQQSPVTTTKGK